MKKNTYLVIVAVLLLVAGIYFMTSTNQNNNISQDSNGDSNESTQVVKLSPAQLKVKLAQKDFVLIDVHTPEQVHVPTTDYLIPHTDIDSIESQLESKDTPVVLYCRSGNMSDIASKDLIERGYTNVYDLEGGMNAWLANKFETTEIGSVTKI